MRQVDGKVKAGGEENARVVLFFFFSHPDF